MALFKKHNDNLEEFGKTMDEYKAMKETFEATHPKENWVWVEGYKGTDKDMKCLGFQYELGKVYTYDGELDPCRKGFHFCPKLESVIDHHYKVGKGNRYFKVRALINLNQTITIRNNLYPTDIPPITKLMTDTDKRVAKQIEFLEEVPVDEIVKILYPTSYTELSDEFKNNLIQFNVETAFKIQDINNLKATGVYSQEIIDIINIENKLKLAYALAKENISQDTRLMILFK